MGRSVPRKTKGSTCGYPRQKAPDHHCSGSAEPEPRGCDMSIPLVVVGAMTAHVLEHHTTDTSQISGMNHVMAASESTDVSVPVETACGGSARPRGTLRRTRAEAPTSGCGTRRGSSRESTPRTRRERDEVRHGIESSRTR